MKKYYSHIVSAFVLLVLLLPIIVSAQSWFSNVTCNPTLVGTSTIANPCDFNALVRMVNFVINWFVGISISVAAITFAVAGGKMLLHPDQEGEREAAKEMFKKTIIGMLIVLGAWLVVHTVVGALTSGSGATPLRFLQ
jgi:hypothetical protein